MPRLEVELFLGHGALEGTVFVGAAAWCCTQVFAFAALKGAALPILVLVDNR